jgi:hypothetical protein
MRARRGAAPRGGHWTGVPYNSEGGCIRKIPKGPPSRSAEGDRVGARQRGDHALGANSIHICTRALGGSRDFDN